MSDSVKFWSDYYAKHKDPNEPSRFAKFVMPFLKEGKKLCELGCGNGRDSIYFAENGIKTHSFDQCADEMAYLNDKFSALGGVAFASGDFTNLEPLNELDYVYSRFTLHAIDEEGQNRTLRWSYSNLENGGLFFIEVRSTNDEMYGVGEEVTKNAFVSDHYRRFLVLEELVEELEQIGFSVLYRTQSKGFAPYKDLDPEVIRVVAQKMD